MTTNSILLAIVVVAALAVAVLLVRVSLRKLRVFVRHFWPH